MSMLHIQEFKKNIFGSTYFVHSRKEKTVIFMSNKVNSLTEGFLTHYFHSKKLKMLIKKIHLYYNSPINCYYLIFF